MDFDSANRHTGISRRRALRLIGGAATALAGGGPALAAALAQTKAAPSTLPSCIVRPEQSEGPYFIDEKLHRSDIRVDPTDRSVSAGVPLRLEFRVSRVAEAACAPLDGAIVDVWHCDALGVYSDVRDAGFDTRGKKFLRGYQTTDGKGAAQFVTIYPGWYAGRTVHIHFKIRSAGQGTRTREFTSQLYFDEAVNDEIFKQAPYASQSGRRIRNSGDFLFRNGGQQLLVTPTKDAVGYAVKFDIGLRLR